MQHMVSLVQLGVLRSVRAGGELHCLAAMRFMAEGGRFDN